MHYAIPSQPSLAKQKPAEKPAENPNKQKKSNRFNDAPPYNPPSYVVNTTITDHISTLQKKSPYANPNARKSEIYSSSSSSSSNGGSSKDNGAKQQQPSSLKDFVKRSFASCLTDNERGFVNGALAKLIARITADGRLHVHRWELEPIPRMPSAAPERVTLKAPSLSSRQREEVDEQEEKTNKKRKKNRFSDAPPPSDDWSGGHYSHREQISSISPSHGKDKEKEKSKTVLEGVDQLNNCKEELQMRERRANRFSSSSSGHSLSEASSVIYFQDTDMQGQGGSKGKGRKQRIQIPSSSAAGPQAATDQTTSG